MIITRTESYTDWVFQGAHAGEVAARVGVGLFRGSIYFRHAHDNLQSGDKVDREEFFVVLSDGTEYKLGTGLSGEKIQVVNNGVTNDGNVHLEVIGKEAIGVGVSRITRNVTISYDDGKVPVLDTEQLEDILDNLKVSLTGSMKDTAEAVKGELRTELETVVTDVKQECSTATNTVKVELTSQIKSLEESIKSLNDAAKYRAPVARWALDVTSVPMGKGYNLLELPPKSKFGSELFTYNTGTKAVNLSAAAFGVPRVMRIDVALNLSTTSDFGDADVALVIWDKNDGSIIARSLVRLDYLKVAGAGSNISCLQLGTHLYISANANSHPVTNNGVGVHLQNYGGGDITVYPGSMITLSLT